MAKLLLATEQIAALEAHPNIDVRIFNPFAYRGHSNLLRAVEFMFNASRLDYRMHNKLMIVDNAVALIGGRNIGDQYFQIDPNEQLADDDMFAAGPISAILSSTFDEYWNNDMSIPVQALSGKKPSSAILDAHRSALKQQHRALKDDGIDFVTRVASGEPYNGMISGRLPLVWAHAQVVCDSPEKKKVEGGAMVGSLMQRAVVDAANSVRHELLMITPYLIPGKEGMQLFDNLRQRGVTVRILTNSLESSGVLAAQSGYIRYRAPLIASGVELHEIRSLLGNTRGSGETKAISRFGNYSLHGKLFVFDRAKIFIGSMNFDQRSMHLNTEIGLLVDSPELAQQVAARFDAMVQPVNAYRLALRRTMSAAARISCGALRKAATKSNTPASRRAAIGKEPRSICYRCCRGRMNYEANDSRLPRRQPARKRRKARKRKWNFCSSMLPRPVAGFIVMVVGMTPNRRSLIKQTTNSQIEKSVRCDQA